MQDTDSSDTEDEDASEAEIDGKAASKAKPDYDDENAREIDDMIRGLKSESPEPPRVEEEKVVEPAEEEGWFPWSPSAKPGVWELPMEAYLLCFR